MIFDIGPFRLYRCEKNGTLDISFKFMDDNWWPCGWEYGWRDDNRGADEKPIVEFRIGKLMILYVEFYEKGFELWILGFWGFFNKGKYWWEEKRK